MSPDEPVCDDLSGMVLHLAGEAGQVSLALTASSAGARERVGAAALDADEAHKGSGIVPWQCHGTGNDFTITKVTVAREVNCAQ